MFFGSIPALVTPFSANCVDEDSLRSLVEWQIEQGSSGLVPCGTTGESATMSQSEQRRVIELTVEAAGGKVPVIAGCGSYSTAHSIEMVTVPWWFLKLCGDENNGLTGWMGQRLDQLERVLGEREWLAAGRFTVADLLMADVLRVSDIRSFGNRPATEAYVTRVTSRAAFKKAQADQIRHFEAADRKREEERSN